MNEIPRQETQKIIFDDAGRLFHCFNKFRMRLHDFIFSSCTYVLLSVGKTSGIHNNLIFLARNSSSSIRFQRLICKFLQRQTNCFSVFVRNLNFIWNIYSKHQRNPWFKVMNNKYEPMSNLGAQRSWLLKLVKVYAEFFKTLSFFTKTGSIFFLFKQKFHLFACRQRTWRNC